MTKIITIFAALLLTGAVLYMIRQNEQETRNKAAIQRTIKAVKDSRVRRSTGQETRSQGRVDSSPAGARFRQLQSR